MDKPVANSKLRQAKWKEAAAWLSAVAFGLLLSMLADPAGVSNPADSGQALWMKVRSRAQDCSWSRTITYAASQNRYQRILARYQDRIAGGFYDMALPVERVVTPKRVFWVPESTELAEQLAELDWLAESNPNDFVHRGDTVIDLRAGAGLFVSKALEVGADKVIAVEPDPLLRECLRRNFASEIARGQVTVLELPSPLPKANFIRAEGAELPGLEGSHPRIMTSGRMAGLPAGYTANCGPCKVAQARLAPRVQYWR